MTASAELVQTIDQQLEALHDEETRLQAARAALTPAGPRPARTRGDTQTPSRSPRRRQRSHRRTARGGQPTRGDQARALIEKHGPQTAVELATRMGIEANYLYRALPRAGMKQDPKTKAWS